MRAFITGASGFIGGHVVRRVVENGHEPVCLARPTSDTAGLEEKGVDLITGDVADRASLIEGMAGCDWVVNLANTYSWWVPDRRLYTTVNLEGTRNVMECALATGVSKVVHVSTAYVYGKPATSPFVEETPVGPARPSHYTRSKYQGDLLALQLHHENGLPLVIIYPGTVIGPGDPKAAGRYVRRLLAGSVPRIAFPDAVHTYVYVGDVAEAIVLTLEKEGNQGERYLIGKDHMSNLEMAESVSDVSGVAIPPTAPAPVSLLVSALVTLVADLTNRPPALPPLDYTRVIKEWPSAPMVARLHRPASTARSGCGTSPPAPKWPSPSTHRRPWGLHSASPGRRSRQPEPMVASSSTTGIRSKRSASW
jgi:dihydroflavonol-4-reductase